MSKAATFLIGLALGLAVVAVVLFVQNADDEDDDDRDVRSEATTPSPIPGQAGTFEITGDVTVASTTNAVSPAPTASPDSASGQTGTFDIVIHDLSESLNACDIREGEAAIVFIDEETVFEPADLVQDPDYPANFTGRRVTVTGVITTLPDDSCRLVAQRIVAPARSSPRPSPTG